MRKNRIQTIDEYIKTFPEDIQIILEKIRQTIRKAAPEAVEAISYGIPTFKVNGKYLVYFAAWKIISDSIRYHQPLMPSKESCPRTSKEKVPSNSHWTKPIPYDLIKKILIFRVKEEKLSPL